MSSTKLLLAASVLEDTAELLHNTCKTDVPRPSDIEFALSDVKAAAAAYTFAWLVDQALDANRNSEHVVGVAFDLDDESDCLGCPDYDECHEEG
jgi:hypothetical protein